MTTLRALLFSSPAAPLAFPSNVVAWVVMAYHVAFTGAVNGLHAVSQHTGVPVVVIAAIALVLSYRFARRAARLALEVGIVVAVLLAATKLGWIHW